MVYFPIAAYSIARQADDDLTLAGFTVPIVTERREDVLCAFEMPQNSIIQARVQGSRDNPAHLVSCDQLNTMPPHTLSVCPVTKAAASEARNTAGPATSSG